MTRRILIIGVLLFIVLASNILARSPSTTQEAIVHIASSDLISFPEGQTKAPTPIEGIEFNSFNLGSLCEASGVTSIARAFPDLTETNITTFDGRGVDIGDKSNVLVFTFESAEACQQFLDEVTTTSSIDSQVNRANELIKAKNLITIEDIRAEISQDPEYQMLVQRHNHHPEILYAEPRVPSQTKWKDIRQIIEGIQLHQPEPLGQLKAGGGKSPVPNDPLYPGQWNLQYGGRAGIRANVAWDHQQTSTNRGTAFLDDGGLCPHEDQSIRGDQTGWQHYHGTATASVAGARTDNARGMAGVAWSTTIRGVDIGSASHDEIAGGIYAAMTDCGIINISAGHQSFSYNSGVAVRDALNADYFISAATGNEGSFYASYPASWVCGVGATTDLAQRASFSNRHPDLMAPGGNGGTAGPEDVRAAFTDDPWYSWYSGTSYSAPHVTGLAGLLCTYMRNEVPGNYNMTRHDMQRIMEVTARDLGEVGWDVNYGHGLITASDALGLILEESDNRLRRQSASGHDWVEEHPIVAIGACIPGYAPGAYFVRPIQCYKNVDWNHPCISTPHVWVNGSYSLGWLDMSPQFGTNQGGVVDGSISTTSATLYTYVFDFWDFAGEPCGRHPCDAHEVSYDYTVLGEFNLFQPSLAVGLVQNADNHHFHVTWTDDNEFHEGYQLQYAAGTPSGWTTVAELPPSCYSYNYEPVWGSAMYYFRVRATIGDSHFSDWSDEAGILNVPNPPTDPHVTLHQVCGWPDQSKLAAEYHPDSYFPPDSLLGFPDLPQNPSGTLYDLAPEPGPDPPPCFPTNRAYVSWSPPENQAAPVDYYNIRLLLYLGGMPTVYWVGPFSAQACTLCLWPNKEYRLNVVAYKYGLHSDEVVNTQIFTTGETIACTDYSHKGTPPEDPGSEEPGIKSNLASNQYSLVQNQPNPFNPETEMSYNLPEDCMVKLIIYNMLGQKVRVLVDEQQMLGFKTVHWNGKDDDGNPVASGIYLYRLQAGEYVEVRKMILLR